MSAQLNHTKRKASSSPERSSFHDRPLPKPPPIRDRPIAFLDVFNREERYPIYNRFCSLLPIAEISLSRTCTKFANVYQDLVPGQWNVDRRRRLFVQSPRTFRSRMGQHDALYLAALHCNSLEECSGRNQIWIFFNRARSWSYGILPILVQRGGGLYPCQIRRQRSV